MHFTVTRHFIQISKIAGCDTVQDRNEISLPPLQLLVIADDELTVTALLACSIPF